MTTAVTISDYVHKHDIKRLADCCKNPTKVNEFLQDVCGVINWHALNQ